MLLMRYRLNYIICFFVFVVISNISLLAQGNSLANESNDTNSVNITPNTSNKDNADNIQVEYVPLSKSSIGAILRSAAVPGWGQIYVEHYWQGVVFAGAAGFLWYNIISNHINSTDYKKQLNNIEDKTSNEYQIIKNKMITSIDNRDLSGLYLIGVYALSMIDAYTGSHLFDFDAGENKKINFVLFPTNTPIGNLSYSIGIRYSF
jgi:hypothetical protein